MIKHPIVCVHCDYGVWLSGYFTDKPWCVKCELFLEDFETKLEMIE